MLILHFDTLHLNLRTWERGLGQEEMGVIPVFLRTFVRSVRQVCRHSPQSMLRGLDLHSDVTPYVTDDAALVSHQFKPHAVSQTVPPDHGGEVSEIHVSVNELIHPTGCKVSVPQTHHAFMTKKRYKLCRWLTSLPPQLSGIKWPAYTLQGILSSGAVWTSRWLSWAFHTNEPYGFCGCEATLNPVRQWSQFVPNLSSDIRGHEALHHHHRTRCCW